MFYLYSKMFLWLNVAAWTFCLQTWLCQSLLNNSSCTESIILLRCASVVVTITVHHCLFPLWSRAWRRFLATYTTQTKPIKLATNTRNCKFHWNIIYSIRTQLYNHLLYSWKFYNHLLYSWSSNCFLTLKTFIYRGTNVMKE
jgi:hypothetical protein